MTAALNDLRIQSGMRRQFALLQQQERAGARRIGWKVGFGAPAAMEKLGITAPLIGFLLDRAVLHSGATVSLSSWTRPAAEPEIAIEIGRDVAAGASDAEVANAIVAIGPAIELADVDGPMDDVEAILAGDIFQRHVIFGRAILAVRGPALMGWKVNSVGQHEKSSCQPILKGIPGLSRLSCGKSRKRFPPSTGNYTPVISLSQDQSRHRNFWNRPTVI